MLILTGLGNPGSKYEHNRHNIGFLAVDALASRWSFPAYRSKFQGHASEGTIDGVRALLLKPQTYMNDSGRAIGEALKFYKAKPSEVVVFYDELDLAPGRFRMKTGGGAAGHNGVRSTIAHIGPDFRRGRMGIGHPGHKDRVMGHVLSDFHKVDHAWVKALTEAVADSAALLVKGEDERYQAEVMRLAPAEKMDPRAAARES
jgi:PTH1 family peptidyl-tRNA hydrolase